jgi:hypothetical protein
MKNENLEIQRRPYERPQLVKRETLALVSAALLITQVKPDPG